MGVIDIWAALQEATKYSIILPQKKSAAILSIFHREPTVPYSSDRYSRRDLTYDLNGGHRKSVLQEVILARLGLMTTERRSKGFTLPSNREGWEIGRVPLKDREGVARRP